MTVRSALRTDALERSSTQLTNLAARFSAEGTNPNPCFPQLRTYCISRGDIARRRPEHSFLSYALGTIIATRAASVVT
jgi:hypothetical protein